MSVDEIRLPETPEPFREWLLAQGDAPAGGPRQQLRDYLKHLGATDPEIGAGVYTLERQHCVDMPAWTAVWIFDIDIRIGRLTCREAAALLPEPKL